MLELSRSHRTLPDAPTLWELFDYKPLTGELIRKYKSGREKVVRYVSSDGYLAVKVIGENWYTHRIIWKWINGSDPGAMTIDHIDGNRRNNAWINLRSADTTQQHANNHKSKGVYKRLLKNGRVRFQARIKGEDKRVYLGTFDTYDEARASYVKAHVETYGEVSPYYKEFSEKA